jgi:hypothetical protein
VWRRPATKSRGEKLDHEDKVRRKKKEEEKNMGPTHVNRMHRIERKRIRIQEAAERVTPGGKQSFSNTEWKILILTPHTEYNICSEISFAF